ncbi:hypothetical protein [Heyndrickxia sporothermodurans]
MSGKRSDIRHPQHMWSAQSYRPDADCSQSGLVKRLRSALTVERGQIRPTHVLGTGVTMSHLDDNTIRLEARYVSSGDEPPPLTLRCGLITYRDAEFKETKGADGAVMRSVVEQASLMVSGLPANFNQSKGDWTHIVSGRLPKGQGELLGVIPLSGNRARFTIKSCS